MSLLSGQTRLSGLTVSSVLLLCLTTLACQPNCTDLVFPQVIEVVSHYRDGDLTRGHNNRVLIRHPDQSVAWHAHLQQNRVVVGVGSTVAAGELSATGGAAYSSMRSSGTTLSPSTTSSRITFPVSSVTKTKRASSYPTKKRSGVSASNGIHSVGSPIE